MTVTLYNNTSDKRIIGKSKTQIAKLDKVQLLENCSITNPTFLVADVSVVTKANYIHCPELNRYYFIDDTIIVGGGRYHIQCSVDVLESYKTQLLSLNCIVSRAENMANLYLPDNRQASYSDRQIQTKKLSGGTIKPSTLSHSSYCYVLTVAGGTYYAN